jgi:branched-chain amino acid transport system substrate-binding protein
MAEMINQKGGLAIEGDKYNLEVIVYDSELNQAKAVSAANRLIFVDKVKFMVSDIYMADAWFPIADANKVIACVATSVPTILDPKYRYSFNTGSTNFLLSSLPGWFFKNFPDKKTFFCTLPDNPQGHAYDPLMRKGFQALAPDRKLIVEFYPANAADLSALGTKIRVVNPDVLAITGGGPPLVGLVIKAAWQAGYRGLVWNPGAAPVSAFSHLVPMEALEGFVAGATYVEFDAPLSQQAKDFKAAWIAKYGKWETPEISGTTSFGGLLTALQKAGTLDPDKIADVFNNGLKFQGPVAPTQMVNRPDLGNNRTVDGVTSLAMKRIVGGKATLPNANWMPPVEEAVGYFKAVNK